MPSIYVSTTLDKKLRLCDAYFANVAIQTVDDMANNRLFCKMNMFAYCKQLCVRSLRSKRSSMIGLVHTLCKRYHAFATMYHQMKTQYGGNADVRVKHLKKKKTQKSTKPQVRVQTKKIPRPRIRQVRTVTATIESSVVKRKRTTALSFSSAKRGLTNDSHNANAKRPKRTLSIPKQSFQGCTIYLKQHKTAQQQEQQPIVIGIDDYFLNEIRQLELDIFCLQQACDYVRYKTTNT